MSIDGKGFTKKFLKLMADIEKACCGNGNNLFSITTEDTDSVDFSGTGRLSDPLTATVKLSSTVGNILTSNVDGLYATATGDTTSANDGLSILSGVVKLGQLVGAVGNPAQLIESREIPLAGFNIFYSGIGNNVFGTTTNNGAKLQIQGSVGLNQTLLSLKTSAAYTVATPIIQIRDSGDVIVLEARAPQSAGFTSLFIGRNAGTACTTNTCVGFGEDTLRLVTTGTSNNAIGFRALAALLTGTSNTSIGHASSNGLTTGSRNQVIGRTALLRSATASDNIVIGDSSMQEVSANTANVALGTFAMCAAEGTANVAIGYSALFYQNGVPNLTRPCSQNVAIGYEASKTAQIGTGNITLGYHANLTGILGNNNILIGAATDSTASITNTTLIGQGITTALSNIVTVGRDDQNTIIGATNPTVDNGAKLQVIGDITTSAPTAGASGKWKLGQFDNNPVSPTARIKVNIDGVDYWIPAIAA